MKTPPFLLFATLLFWGWQSDLLWWGAITGAVLEGSRWVPARWDLEDVDFNRIWSLCVLLVVGAAAYVFTTNDESGGLGAMFQGGFAGLRRMSASSTLATTSVFRWLPLIFFPFIIAQVYNLRPSVPVTALSLVLRIRRRRGEQSLAGRYVDFSHAYFMVAIFAAGIHANHATYSYFCGQVILILWALRALRSERFGFKIWAVGIAAVVIVGFLGQFGISALERGLQNFDAELFTRFFHSQTDPLKSNTAIGQIGRLKLSPRIVLRLQPELPGVVPNYLREASYWTYSPKNELWLGRGSKNEFESVSHLPGNDNAWELVAGKTNRTHVSIAAYLNGRTRDGIPEGLLPLPSGCDRLEKLPAYTLDVNKTGAVLATGPGLMIFDARYGPGATFDAPPDDSTNHFDLAVPTNEVPALQKVIAEMNLTNATDPEKLRVVQSFLAQNFTYSTWQGLDKRATANASPLTKFLLTSRSGHCEYFATATVLLLRQLGIPARYAVGYSVHEAAGSGYVVRERDAHAWCLAWNNESRVWEDFDTTPGSWLAVEGRNASLADTLSDLRSWLTFQFERLRWRESNFRRYIFWTISPVIAVLLYYILFKHRRKARLQRKTGGRAPDVWPGLDSAFYRLETALAARGLPRQPQEPLSEWLERALRDPELGPLRPTLRALLRLHYRYRFDPRGLSDDQKNALEREAQATLEVLSRK